MQIIVNRLKPRHRNKTLSVRSFFLDDQFPTTFLDEKLSKYSDDFFAVYRHKLVSGIFKFLLGFMRMKLVRPSQYA